MSEEKISSTIQGEAAVDCHLVDSAPSEIEHQETLERFDFEAAINFSDPSVPVFFIKIPRRVLEGLMEGSRRSINITAEEITDVLHAFSLDPQTPLAERGEAIKLLLKRSL
jgi:hypothetical protein